MSNYSILGRTDLSITKIGLGTNTVGSPNLNPNVNDATGKELVRTAIENGINFLDTAFVYGLGHSEELIGEVLKETGKRSELIIATKAAHKLVDGKIELDNSRDFMRESVEVSLQRLQIESIDLFYVHFPDGKTPLAEVAGTLNELKLEGKIKAIGLSNVNLEQLKEFNVDGYLDALQNNYSLLARDAEQEVLPYCAEQSITFIPYFPLASGLLSGKYKPDSVFNDSRAKKPNFQGEAYLAILAKVEKLNAIAANKGVETAQLALAWLLTRPAVGAVIPGSKSVDQVLHNRKTLDIVLSGDEVQAISDIFQP